MGSNGWSAGALSGALAPLHQASGTNGETGLQGFVLVIGSHSADFRGFT
jgi:hypothetical protein